MTAKLDNGRSTFARGDIENLCLLSAIPGEGCDLAEFPARLGLSPLLQDPVAQAIGPLINAGWINVSEGRIAVSGAGRAWLKEHLEASA